MASENQKQLNFWIDKNKLVEIDAFVEKANYHTRTKFLLKSLNTTMKNPELLEEDYLRKLQSDRELLKELIKLFDRIPCEFDFDARSHEFARIQEIQKELGINER